MGKIITIKEAAERLGKTEQTIRNWVKGGHIKASFVGKAVYIDEAIINAMTASVSDIERAEAFITEMREERERERQEEQEARTDRVERRRFMNIAYFNGTQMGLFENVLGLLNAYGDISDKELQMITMRLHDYPLQCIAVKYGLNRESVRKIVEKAYRKCRHSIDEIKTILDEAKDLKVQNEMLLQNVRALRKKIKKYEDMAEEEPMSDEMYKLLSTKVFDIDISIRTLHILMAMDVKTVADMCRITQSQFMDMRNAGKKSWAEVEEFITFHGLKSGEDYTSRMIWYKNK